MMMIIEISLGKTSIESISGRQANNFGCCSFEKYENISWLFIYTPHSFHQPTYINMEKHMLIWGFSGQLEQFFFSSAQKFQVPWKQFSM